MLPTLQRVFCRRRPILHRHGRTGLVGFWIDLFSGAKILICTVWFCAPAVLSSSDSASRICSELSSRWNSRSLNVVSPADLKDVLPEIRRFGAKPHKKIVDGQAASPSSWKTPCMASSDGIVVAIDRSWVLCRRGWAEMAERRRAGV